MTAAPQDSHDETSACHSIVSLGETDPVIAGLQVVELFNDSARDYVEACVVVARISGLHAQSSREFIAFVDVLVEAKIVSRREGNRGAQSGKLSKLRKIGENRDLLLRPEIIRCVELGYTVAYQACLLHEALPGTPEEKNIALGLKIENAGDLSKEFLIEETAKVKGSSEAGSNVGPSPSTLDQPPPIPLNLHGIDGLLATPTREDIRALAGSYVDDAALFRCLPMHERVADDATLVVIARIVDVPTIVTRLLPCCGFKRISHALLLRQPSTVEVTDSDVVIIAHRGEVAPLFLTDWTWLEDGAPLDPIHIAERIIQNAECRLHMFASAENEGWHSLTGDATWAEKPSIK